MRLSITGPVRADAVPRAREFGACRRRPARRLRIWPLPCARYVGAYRDRGLLTWMTARLAPTAVCWAPVARHAGGDQAAQALPPIRCDPLRCRLAADDHAARQRGSRDGRACRRPLDPRSSQRLKRSLRHGSASISMIRREDHQRKHLEPHVVGGELRAGAAGDEGDLDLAGAARDASSDGVAAPARARGDARRPPRRRRWRSGGRCDGRNRAPWSGPRRGSAGPGSGARRCGWRRASWRRAARRCAAASRCRDHARPRRTGGSYSRDCLGRRRRCRDGPAPASR